jgi:AcrR family transcriptional regulator
MSVSQVTEAKPRIVKAAAVRRAELIDVAQGLFLTRGYERTTINDVIQATGLSKGAFYHHFRAKEDLLEAIAERFSRESLGFTGRLRADPSLDALARLNLMLAVGRDWKLEHLAELKAMFTTLLKPENAVLYHRIIEAVTAVLAPELAAMIADGQAQGVFAAGDPHLMAETMLAGSYSRRAVVVAALSLAETDPDAATRMIVRRVRAEEALFDRILGLTPGGVDLLGSEADLREMLERWARGGRSVRFPHVEVKESYAPPS